MSLSKFIKLATGATPDDDLDLWAGDLEGLDANGDPIVPTVPQSVSARPGGGAAVKPKAKPEPNLTPTINDFADWLKPMGIGGAAGAGIQYWRRQKEIDRHLKAGYSQAEAEDLVETNVGAGALLGAGLGAGYKWYNDPYTGPRKT
jgi:hypothetical protein